MARETAVNDYNAPVRTEHPVRDDRRLMRLPHAEKSRWQDAAARDRVTLTEYVRSAVNERLEQ
jgi:hypothetical protein